MHWPLSLEESKDFCPISNRNFLPVPSKSAGRSCMIKYALTISIEFWFTVSVVSYFSSRSWFGHTEHIKESLQICYTSPRCSRLPSTHSALPQFHEKDGLFYSLSSERHHSIFLLKKKSNISVCCNTDNMTGFYRSVMVYGLFQQMIFELLQKDRLMTLVCHLVEESDISSHWAQQNILTCCKATIFT